MQAVSLAKDKIKRFRRRTSSTGSVLHHSNHRHSHNDRHDSNHDASDLPPPYTENPPPLNPFYNDYSGSGFGGGGGVASRSRSFDYEYHRDIYCVSNSCSSKS